MRSFWTLTRKECRQHGWSLLALTVTLTLAVLLLLWNVGSTRRVLSYFEAVSRFLIFFIPLAALVLSGRLVVSEYQGRTQLFIESLPIRRTSMVSMKYGFGLIYLFAVAVSAILAVAGLALQTEPVGTRFLLLLTLRALVFIYCLWSILFAMGFTGRFRIPLYIGIFLAILALNNMTELDLMRVGPLALINPETFPFERERIPWAEIRQTMAIGTAWLILALVLALVHEGSVAEALSRKMTQREKVVSSVLLLGFLFAIGTLEQKTPKTPFRFESRAVVSSDTYPLTILYVKDEARADANQLLQHLGTSLRLLTNTLGLSPVPPINIAFSAALDRRTFETATLHGVDGVLIRANFPQFDDHDRSTFAAYVLRHLLDHSTLGRARFEPKRWLHDGFSRWWVEHGHERVTSAPPTYLILRALIAVRSESVREDTIKHWTWLREQKGERLTEALAYTGLRALEARDGRNAVLRLAKAVFGRRPPHDARETIYEWFHPMPRVFQDATAMAWSDFITAWNTWLQNRRREPGIIETMRKIPSGHADIDIVPTVGNIREIAYGIRFDPIPRVVDRVCAFLHQKLSPYDRELLMHTLKREEYVCGAATQPQHLTGHYGAGERVFVALEVDADELGAPIRVFAKRMVIP